jgi:signal transduction histidine kinase
MSGITAIAIVCVLVALAGGTLLLARQFIVGEAQTRLETDASETAQDVRNGATPAAVSGAFYLIWGPDGQIVTAPPGVSPAPFESAARDAQSGAHRIDVINVSGSPMLVDSRLVLDRNGRLLGVVQTAIPLAPVTAIENGLLASVAIAGAGALALTVLAAWLVAGRTTRPVEAALRRQRQFTADASHELRTPLTVIDASLQVLKRHPERTVRTSIDVVDAAQREVGRMARMLDALLTLARADTDSRPNAPVRIDVDAMLISLGDELLPRAAETKHPLTVDGSGVGMLEVDPELLRQLILILVDNALVHTPEGTPVQVSARRTASSLVVEVVDRGRGIPAAERQRVFERFRRLETATPGTGSGLGLSIARELVIRVGGSIELADAEPGLTARVSIPVSNSRGD